MRSLQFSSSLRTAADVAVGVSADRPVATRTKAAIHIGAPGRYRDRPLQELPTPNKRISFFRYAANGNPAPDARARRTRTQKDHRHLVITEN